jgi:hypothetical protein
MASLGRKARHEGCLHKIKETLSKIGVCRMMTKYTSHTTLTVMLLFPNYVSKSSMNRLNFFQHFQRFLNSRTVSAKINVKNPRTPQVKYLEISVPNGFCVGLTAEAWEAQSEAK